MNMRAYDIIIKKRDKKSHTLEEIDFLIQGYTSGLIPDYQVSAWLMAGFLNGLNEEETFFLTRAMLNSGKILDLSSILQPKIDKHSTGGVGDKISLILAPAVAACGVMVPMTSGRGLGFSGGTLDKLESIPGFRVDLSEKEFVSVLKKVGYVMSGQTETIAPADRKLYALRDVTGTVECIPFITASILSKKLAEGADAVVMDVKCGSGAFMKTIEDARALAQSLVTITGRMGRQLICVISNMNQPLGSAVGNNLEVIESIECLRGEGPDDVTDLVCVLGGYMLLAAKALNRADATDMAKVLNRVDSGAQRVRDVLKNGEAFKRFVESVRVQGGSVETVQDTRRFARARFSRDVIAGKAGYVSAINTESIGTAAVLLGAGRLKKEDVIDHCAGIFVHKKIGNTVDQGDALATLHFNAEDGAESAFRLVLDAYSITGTKPADFKLVHEVIM